MPIFGFRECRFQTRQSVLHVYMVNCILLPMSPTVFRIKSYRFYFLSNEEKRMHVHITCPEGEAKFWVEPIISLASFYGLSAQKLNDLQKLVEGHKNEIAKKWQTYFCQH